MLCLQLFYCPKCLKKNINPFSFKGWQTRYCVITHTVADKVKSNELHVTLRSIILRTAYFTSSNFLALYCSAPARKFSNMMSHNTVPYIMIIINNIGSFLARFITPEKKDRTLIYTGCVMYTSKNSPLPLTWRLLPCWWVWGSCWTFQPTKEEQWYQQVFSLLGMTTNL